MKITMEFTGQNVLHLLKAVSMYTWVINADKVSGEEDTAVDSFDQMVLGMLYNGGMSEVIEYNEQEGLYFLLNDFEESVLEQLQDYVDETFWTELGQRLARRDAEGQLKNVKDPDQRIEKILAIEGDYENEFNEHGIMRLKIVE